jgi:hypothetical protein
MTNGSPLDEQLAKAIESSTAAKQSEAEAIKAAEAADAARKDARVKASQARGALSDKKTELAMAVSAAKRAKKAHTTARDKPSQKQSEEADSKVIVVEAEVKTAQEAADTAAKSASAAAKSAKEAINAVTAARQQVRVTERNVIKIRQTAAAQGRQTSPVPIDKASSPSDSGANRRALVKLPKLAFPGPDGGPTPSFPILTEEIGYPPSPLASAGGGTSRSSGSGGSSLGLTVNRALQAVLGWKINSDDSVGFSGALTQSFQLKMVEGSVVSTWTPRSYAVQTDLSGGISGAQASIYTMAKTLLDQLQPLITGLYALDPASDSADVAALKDLVSNQLSNLTNEIGNPGGPRVMRVHEYFKMLLGVKLQINYPSSTNKAFSLGTTAQTPPKDSPLHKLFIAKGDPLPQLSWTKPDTVLGSLGDLRDQLGLFESIGQRFINTVADEQNVTNFRIAVDYANSLLNAWSNSIKFFASQSSPFLGTQLVVISRQLGVINETVDEVRFVLDSVFIGPAQRATYQLIYHGDHSPFHASAAATSLDPEISSLPPIYLEDLLQWVQNFVTGEAQEVIQGGGKLGLGEDFKEMIAQLYTQAVGLLLYSQTAGGPGFGSMRVQQSLYKLAAQLLTLFTMADSVGVRYIPPRH